MRPFNLSFLSLTLSAAILLLMVCGTQFPSDLYRDHEHKEDFYMASVEDQSNLE